MAQQLVVRLTGKEPENLILAEQWIPLLPDSQYRIAWDERSPGAGSLPGLNWVVTSSLTSNGAAPTVLGHSPALTPGTEWKSGQFTFETGSNQFAKLSLTYQRPLGSTRAEGTLSVRRITGTRIK